jgi:hypothetical protein
VSCFAILLYEDCNNAIIKKSLNLAVKGYKVIKKPAKIKPSPSKVRGGQPSIEDLLISLSLE